MELSEADVDAIVAQMRAGAGFMVGGSRCHSSYYGRGDTWWVEDFDEGYTQEHVISEESLRSTIRSNTDRTVPLLDIPRWRACKAALFARDWAASARALEGMRDGDHYGYVAMIRAVGAWPERAVSDAERAQLAEAERGSMLFHAFMNGAGWERTSSARECGLAWIERVEAILGQPCAKARAAFATLPQG